MKIICSGLSKTGTKSLAQALRTLGYTVYDSTESYTYHIQQWHDMAVKKKTPDFVSMYSEVDAVVAVPANLFYREICEAFPDAKVILTIRDNEDVWVKSFVKQARIHLRNEAVQPLWLAVLASPTYRTVYRAVHRLWSRQYNVRPGYLDDEAGLKEIYRKHNEEVKQSVPAGQLLVYNLQEGWRPLCDFLKVEAPSSQFPHLNKDGEWSKKRFPPLVVHEVGETIIKETILIFSGLILFISVLVYYCLKA